MSSAAAIGSAAARLHLPDVEIVFADLDLCRSLLENEEVDTPRLSMADTLRADRLAGDPGRQSLWRAARIATRIVLERAAGTQVRGVDFEIRDGGRPELGRGFPYFNVSHTGHVALIAVCRSSYVGVDIERHRALSISAERRRRIIAAAAGLAGDSALDPDCDADVLRAWVRLEAIAKARGAGIGVLLTEEGVIGGAGSTRAKSQKSLPSVVDLDAGAEYVAAIAGDRLSDSIAIKSFPSQAGDLREFLSEFRG